MTETLALQLHRLVADAWMQIVADQQVLVTLKEYLNETIVVPDGKLPSSVVGIDSLVTLEFEQGCIETLTLVVPENANILAARLSVLSPIGVAIVGHREGETVTTPESDRSRRVSIAHVNQWPLCRKEPNHPSQPMFGYPAFANVENE